MSNKELYKRSFDKLQPTKDFQKELNAMMEKKENVHVFKPRRVLALVAVVAVVLSLGIATSASGLMQTVRVWINGEEVDAQGYMKYEEGSDFVIEVEGEDAGTVDVIYSEGEVGEAGEEMVLVAPVDAAYEYRDGRDILCLTNTETGETQELDVTDKLVDGRYQDTITVFGWTCTVDLSVEGESTSFSFAVESAAE